MVSIIRNGQEIQLTPEEIRTVLEHSHRSDIRYNVETALEAYEDDGVISFENWHDCGFADYSSESDAREDFIDCIIEHILDMEDTINERTPIGHRYEPNYEDEVYDTAEDYGYLKES